MRSEMEAVFAADGHREQLEVIRTPMVDDNGRLIGVLAVARDVTETRAMQAALRDAVSAGLPFRGAILNYRKNGQPFWNQLAIDPIRGANGDMLGYVGI